MNRFDIPRDDAEGNTNSTSGSNGASLNGGGAHADNTPPHDNIPDNDGIRIEEFGVVDDTAPKNSEMDVASEFAGRYAYTVRYVAPWKKWLIWNGQRWEDDDKRQAHALADQLCREYARLAGKRALTVASAGFRTAVLSLASDDQQLAATVDQFDTNPWLLNTPGCVVDLRTGKWGEAKPEYMMRMMTSVAPARVRADGASGCPRWMAFLNQIFNNDEKLVKYVQKVSGYALTGVITEHQFWFGYGLGNNGKGVYLRVLRALMGDYATTAPIETFTVQKFENHPTELARLVGKRLVTSSETEEGRRWAEARIKEITGGDEINARFMREDFFQFLPQFKLFITGKRRSVQIRRDTIRI